MSSREFYDTIKYISICSALVPITASVIRFQVLDAALRVLFGYFIVSLSADVASQRLSFYGIHNYFVFNIFTFLECALLSTVYLYRFGQSTARKLIISAFIIFSLIVIRQWLIFGGYNSRDSVVGMVEGFFMIMLSASYFYKLMSELLIRNLTEDYFTWINAGILLYFCLEIVLVGFNWYLEKCQLQRFFYLYTPHLIFNTGKNVALAVGIWKKTQK